MSDISDIVISVISDIEQIDIMKVLCLLQNKRKIVR